jgi:hypothetical protein
MSEVIPPGWHSDPWQQATYRWWDGNDWTAHISGPAPVLAPRWDPNLAYEDPRVLRERLVRAGGWLRLALLFLVPIQVVSTVAVGLGERPVLKQMFRAFDTGSDRNTVAVHPNGLLVLGQLTSLVASAILVLRMVWMFRAARLGRQVGIPPRRDPGLACAGWIIPIVNFWWPYQDLRALGQGRAAAGRMWALYVSSAIGNLAALVAVVVSTSVGLVCVVAVAALQLASIAAERGVVQVIEGVLSERVPAG